VNLNQSENRFDQGWEIAVLLELFLENIQTKSVALDFVLLSIPYTYFMCTLWTWGSRKFIFQIQMANRCLTWLIDSIEIIKTTVGIIHPLNVIPYFYMECKNKLNEEKKLKAIAQIDKIEQRWKW